MIVLQLTQEEATFLANELAKERWEVKNELLHSDGRPMHGDLARELEEIDRLRDKVTHALDIAMTDAVG